MGESMGTLRGVGRATEARSSYISTREVQEAPVDDKPGSPQVVERNDGNVAALLRRRSPVAIRSLALAQTNNCPLLWT